MMTEIKATLILNPIGVNPFDKVHRGLKMTKHILKFVCLSASLSGSTRVST